MRKWAGKRDSDGLIVVVQCNSDPQNFLDKLNDGPYTLLNEVTDSNPLPDRKYTDKWKDNGSGDIEITQTDMDSTNFISLREQRDKLLFDSDWTQGLDTALDKAKVEEWRTYRQALRDLPSNTIDAENPTWPTIVS